MIQKISFLYICVHSSHDQTIDSLIENVSSAQIGVIMIGNKIFKNPTT